ncbi:uncharacterized protein EURHEDRAFT_525017 [Aspergillus ruber CBS 135680]|uniref:Transmembrane protein n=1 Tax=Aspergillus ruber (strain CBS 135680) TaxID=1388766 RepID=A0A017S983_ASPRC|nr:uncharacterized protein EURHEDRAFT_525017 [Aspergillus ruber CBS 135680]EYE93189.1 hypothetical protein EURHEDRAFT_525017 [Aspergillus ruber CBS 135680]
MGMSPALIVLRYLLSAALIAMGIALTGLWDETLKVLTGDQLLWLLFLLIWETIQLFIYRIRVMDSHNSRQGIEDEGIVKEDTWSSGQLVPVFMLLVPLLLIVEGCSDMIYRRKTEYKNHDGSYSSLAPHIRSQEQLELSSVDYNKDTRLLQDQANRDTVVPPQAMVAHGLSFPMQASAEPLLNRISSLCQRQFHSEPWYLDNMRLAIAVMTGVAGFLFVRGRDDTFIMFVLVLAVSVAFLSCLALIPLCEVLDSLESKQLAKRCPLSVVRIAVDPGKAYRVLRYIYSVFCPISSLGYGVILSVYGTYVSMVPMLIWAGFVCLLIVVASLMVPVFICRQLYSQKTLEVL